MIPALLWPFMGTILLIVASSISIVASGISIMDKILGVVTPILTAIIEFVIWFIKQFFSGLTVIFANLSTLAVMAVVAIGLAGVVRARDIGDCDFKMLDAGKSAAIKQRDADTKYFGKIIEKLEEPTTNSKNKGVTVASLPPVEPAPRPTVDKPSKPKPKATSRQVNEPPLVSTSNTEVAYKTKKKFLPALPELTVLENVLFGGPAKPAAKQKSFQSSSAMDRVGGPTEAPLITDEKILR